MNTTTQPTGRPAGRPYALMAIMAVAILLRAAYFTEIEHNVDHAYPVWQALMTLDRGVFPLAGQGTSVLFANPALTGYLYLPAVALTRSPLGVYVFVVALNALAVLLAYRAVRSLAGSRLALVAAGLMAVNPWVIEYSRTSWVQSLLPFFACAVAWLLWPVLLGQSHKPVRRLAMALIMLTLMTQTYLLAFALLVPVIVLLILFRKRIPRRGLVIGGAAFVLALALYGIGLLGQLDTVEQRLGDFSAGELRLSGEALGHAVRLISGADYAAARGIAAPDGDSALRQDLSQVAHLGVVVALMAGVAWAGWMVISDRRRRGELRTGVLQYAPTNGRKMDAALIALIWFGLPVVMMSYVNQVVHPFYQLIGLPAGYALAAWGLGAIFRPGTRIGAVITLVVLLPFGLLMGINSVRYYQETAATPGIHDLGALPVDYGMQLGRAIADHLPEGGVVFADVDEWTLNSLAGRLFPLIREARAPDFTILPGEGGVYVMMSPPVGMIIVPPPHAATVETLVLADGWHLTVAVFSPNAAATLPCDDNLDVHSEQGITLACYRLVEMSDGWTLITYWRVESRSPAIDAHLFAPFVHLFDSNEFDTDRERVAIVDGEAVPGYVWREGDVHVHVMPITLPEAESGPFRVSVGQYDALAGESVIFILPESGEYTPLIALPDVLARP